MTQDWPVASDAAATLTTRMFAAMAERPTQGRARALQQAMLALMDDGKPLYAHPMFWAPFVVVGEGGVPRAGVPMTGEAG